MEEFSRTCNEAKKTIINNDVAGPSTEANDVTTITSKAGTSKSFIEATTIKTTVTPSKPFTKPGAPTESSSTQLLPNDDDTTDNLPGTSNTSCDSSTTNNVDTSSSTVMKITEPLLVDNEPRKVKRVPAQKMYEARKKRKKSPGFSTQSYAHEARQFHPTTKTNTKKMQSTPSDTPRRKKPVARTSEKPKDSSDSDDMLSSSSSTIINIIEPSEDDSTTAKNKQDDTRLVSVPGPSRISKDNVTIVNVAGSSWISESDPSTVMKIVNPPIESSVSGAIEPHPDGTSQHAIGPSRPNRYVEEFLKSDSVESTIENYDVVIVGAGLAGLTAAHSLLSKVPTLNVVVLESEDRIGGRLVETAMHFKAGEEDGTNFEMGGHVFCDRQTHVAYLLRELGLTTHCLYTKGTKIGQTRKGTCQRYSSELPKLGNYLAELDLKVFIAKVDTMSDNLVRYFHLDVDTTAKFLDDHLHTRAAKEAVVMMIRTTMGLETKFLSAFYFLVYVNAAGGLYNLFNYRQFQIKEGTQALLDELDYRTQCTQLFEKIVSIDQSRDKVTLTSATTKVYRCEYAILAIPPHQILQIHFACENMPGNVMKVFQKFVPGHLTRFVVTYRNTFWREAGDSGEVFGNGGPSTTCERGPVQITYDATSPDGHAAISGILGGKQSIAWSKVPYAERKAQRLQQLAKYWGPAALKPIDYAEFVWPTGGGGVAPGLMGYFAEVYEQCGSILWAGTEVSNRWPGFMDGAVNAGLKASMEVLMSVRPQALRWQDYAVIERMPPSPHYTGVASAAGYVKNGLKVAAVVGLGYAGYKLVIYWT